jgi:type II secretory pathway pseudopilin PulG
MKYLKGNKPPEAGLTLLEVVFTSAILLIAITALLYTFVNCILLNASNKELLTAANDAQYVLEQIKSRAFSDIIGDYAPPNLANLQNETISVPAEASISSRVKEVTVNVSWTDKRRRARSYVLTTRIFGQE